MTETTCESNDLNIAIDEAEEKWLTALLLKLKVPKPVLKKRKAGEWSNGKWRDILFNNYQINIYKNLSTSLVTVYKYSTKVDENVKVGEWKAPEVIRLKGKGKCKLRLKCWQLV